MNDPYVDGVRTSVEPVDLHAVSRDLWPRTTLRMWHGHRGPRPRLVCWPETETEVERVLVRAAREKTAVVTYGAGSGVCGGAGGLAGSVVLDTKAMHRIGPLDAERWTVEAEAGANGQQLEDYLNARGFTLGHSPSSIWCSTVGGWAAARGAGQFSSKYGVFEDMVLGLRAVAPGIGPFEVGDRQWSTPWEGRREDDSLLPMLLGNEGTLGVITQVRMRVWPSPATRWLRGYRFPTVASAVRAMRILMQSELWPAVVRLYDPADTRIGGRTRPRSEKSESRYRFLADWIRAVDRIPAVRKRELILPLRLPRLVNRLFEGLSDGCLVIAGWEGDERVVQALSERGHRLLCEEGEDLGSGPGERWFHSRHAVSYKLMPIFERGGFADTMEVACRWSDMTRLYDAVRTALGRTTVVMAHMSHAYSEGGSIYFSFAGPGDAAVYQATWDAALEACISVGATVTHHHGVGQLKAAAASTEVGVAVAGWRECKARLDPVGILNPGRLFVDVPSREPASVPELMSQDGLARAGVNATLSDRRLAAAEVGGEPMWPWETLPGARRWTRLPWQVGWSEVAGTVGGSRCILGRGPRSAAGPDLRQWLVANSDESTTASFPVVPCGERWLGTGTPPDPWAVARNLLRSDLRPAVLTVVQSTLRVGFRGPAAAALGAIASARVPGGLTEVPWKTVPLPSGPLEWCEIDDPEVVAVVPAGALRRSG